MENKQLYRILYVCGQEDNNNYEDRVGFSGKAQEVLAQGLQISEATKIIKRNRILNRWKKSGL